MAEQKDERGKEWEGEKNEGGEKEKRGKHKNACTPACRKAKTRFVSLAACPRRTHRCAHSRMHIK
jgi:hypothetical protein